MNNLIKISIHSLVFIHYATPSFAYVDPGTGSIILQALIALLAGAVVTVKFYWHKLLKLFGLEKKKNSDKNDIKNNKINLNEKKK